jgi:hypothetical protein
VCVIEVVCGVVVAWGPSQFYPEDTEMPLTKPISS